MQASSALITTVSYRLSCNPVVRSNLGKVGSESGTKWCELTPPPPPSEISCVFSHIYVLLSTNTVFTAFMSMIQKTSPRSSFFCTPFSVHVFGPAVSAALWTALLCSSAAHRRPLWWQYSVDSLPVRHDDKSQHAPAEAAVPLVEACTSMVMWY